jgi:hypothetical protein
VGYLILQGDAKEKNMERKKRPAEQLKPYLWKPGQSGNPKGRPPKDRCITDAMRRLIKDQDMAEALARGALKRALKNGNDLNLVLNRTEGPVQQNVAFDPNAPMVVNINRIVAHVEDNDDSNTD